MTNQPTQKRSLEDIAATQADHTVVLARIVERLDDLREEIVNHTDMLRAHTELLKEIKALVTKEGK